MLQIHIEKLSALHIYSRETNILKGVSVTRYSMPTHFLWKTNILLSKKDASVFLTLRNVYLA